jgi:hypothetical protein
MVFPVGVSRQALAGIPLIVAIIKRGTRTMLRRGGCGRSGILLLLLLGVFLGVIRMERSSCHLIEGGGGERGTGTIISIQRKHRNNMHGLLGFGFGKHSSVPVGPTWTRIRGGARSPPKSAAPKSVKFAVPKDDEETANSLVRKPSSKQISSNRQSTFQSFLAYLDENHSEEKLKSYLTYFSLSVSLLWSHVLWPKDPIKQQAITSASRVLYAAYLVVYQLLFSYIGSKIKRNRDRSVVVADETKLFARKQLQNSLGLDVMSLFGSQSSQGQSNPFGADDEQQLTVKEYDSKQLRGLKQTFFFDLFKSSIYHFLMKSTSALALDSLNGIITLLFHPLFRIYVVGQPATGKCQRPFPRKPGTLENILRSYTTAPVDSPENDKNDEQIAEDRAIYEEAEPPRSTLSDDDDDQETGQGAEMTNDSAQLAENPDSISITSSDVSKVDQPPQTEKKSPQARRRGGHKRRNKHSIMLN